MNKRERAKRLLIFYFAQALDGVISKDSVTEISELVDLLIDAAKEELQDDEVQSEIEENLFHRF